MVDAKVASYIQEHQQDALEDLLRFCGQPSVSAQNLGVAECAELARAMLVEAGARAQLLPTRGGPPVVYGEIAGDSARTLLIYDHYDVQPAEPLELWHSPPFQPTVREGKVFARGVYDDKGQFVARLNAVKALLRVRGRLPCRVKFFLEGEEETGSTYLPAFVEEHRGLLQADACLWEAGSVTWDGRPIISLGLKGILYVELVARGPNRDVHSSLGAVVPNPAWRLLWALDSIKGPGETIKIRGFYDSVQPATSQEVEAIRRMPPEEEQIRASLGLSAFVLGLQGEEARRRYLLEPSTSICGLEAGYTGPGAKTVLPSVARAKLDFRLVPRQRPEEVLEQLKTHLKAEGFEDIEVVVSSGSSPPARTPMDSPWVTLLESTAREVYGKEPVVIPTVAGSGPMYYFAEVLKQPTAASAGVGYIDSRPHAPDEHIRLEDFLKGMLHTAAVLEAFGAAGR
ncbi:MAG: M20/M25/M40 family metallo-hydrolase [Chloroflexi bacterium]|nr:M20/M25/M40 family metallo-hydrolase [Chloroflexota bacterium]